MNNPEFELLVYLITSAKALPEEPASYGSIRLTEAASRLCKIICEKYPEMLTVHCLVVLTQTKERH